MSENSTAPRRTQAERRSESEEALLGAAADLVAERGIERASLASIGERAGASRGLPTHHFGSKDALIERLARRAQDCIQDSMVAGVERATRAGGDLSELDLILVSVDIYLEIFFDNPSPEERALLVIWGSTFPSSSSVEGLAEAHRRSYQGWADLIEAGQEAGSIRGDIDSDSFAVLILGMIRGVAGLSLTDDGVVDTQLVRDSCRASLSAALAPQSHGG
jgi:AcrR family transcriptional regulator